MDAPDDNDGHKVMTIIHMELFGTIDLKTQMRENLLFSLNLLKTKNLLYIFDIWLVVLYSCNTNNTNFK